MFVSHTALLLYTIDKIKKTDYRKVEHKLGYIDKAHQGLLSHRAHRFLLLFDGPFLLHIVTINLQISVVS